MGKAWVFWGWAIPISVKKLGDRSTMKIRVSWSELDKNFGWGSYG